MIECEGLTKRFGNFTAVDHVSFSVGKGSIFGFLGPNGSGKSTVIRMLCGILEPTEGSARIAGNGKDGLKLMSSYAPHGLLLDLALPEMSGVEVLKTLRAEAATADLPVIVFTNSFLPQPIKEALA